MKISDLKALEKNPFKAKDDKQIEKIGKSIKDFERMMSISQENRDFFCIFTYCFIGHLTLSDNKEIKKVFKEAGFNDNCPTDPFEVSDADTMLEYLKSNA